MFHKSGIRNGPLSAPDRKPRGRPPAATRDEVVEAALRAYLHGERIDVLAIAARLGVARTSIYRWFGSREELIGRVVVIAAEAALDEARAGTRGRGGAALLETIDRFNRRVAAAAALHRFVENERGTALGIICASSGVVTPGVSRRIADLIEAEASAGAYEPPLDPYVLAHAIVKVGQAFLFNHGEASMLGAVDLAQLREVDAALLRVAPGP